MRALITLVRNLLRIVFWPLAVLGRKPTDVLRVGVKGAPPALPRRRPFWDRRPAPVSIRTLERRLARAGEDPSLPCILVEIGHLGLGWSSLETLHELLAGAGRKGAGKRVVAYLPEGGGPRELYVASAADEIWMAPSAALSLTGLKVESTYLADALEAAGLAAQVEAMGRFKNAGEPLVSNEMSPESRLVLGEVLDEVERLILPALAEGRRMGEERARELLGRGPYAADRAEELGLVDGVCYPDQLASRLAPDGRQEARIRRWPAYARGRVLALGRWPWQARSLAVLELSGVIVDGESPAMKGVLGAKDAVKALELLRKDRSVAAVVLHVDSRGGTVLGSDQIRREVERLARRKPVVACMGDVAASGGYMIASAAHTVLARRATLTGSIGVVAGKLSARRLLEGLGLRLASLRRGENTAFDSTVEPWSAGERAALRAMIASSYRHFIEVVAKGRRMPPETIEASAEGRVWTGSAALERGLVDRLGGLSEAIAAAREAAPEARKAVVEPVLPRRPRLPRLGLPGPLGAIAALALAASSTRPLAIEPFDLHVR